jgi:hypothetical protein
MKRKFNYLFLMLLLLATAGCIKNSNDPSNIIIPVGNFAGQFTRIHLSRATGKLDTIKANITLNLAVATGYAVGGDTTHHAASHGGYVVDGQNIAFSDLTLPANSTSTAPLAKTHLNGVYQYTYTGTSMQISASNDTLGYLYVLALKP